MSPLVEPQPGNRFVSFVRASGRGEAKLRGRAGGSMLCVARAPAGPVTCSAARRSVPGWVVPLVVPLVVPRAVLGWVVPPVVPLVVPQVMNQVVSQVVSLVVSQVNRVS